MVPVMSRYARRTNSSSVQAAEAGILASASFLSMWVSMSLARAAASFLASGAGPAGALTGGWAATGGAGGLAGLMSNFFLFLAFFSGGCPARAVLVASPA